MIAGFDVAHHHFAIELLQRQCRLRISTWLVCLKTPIREAHGAAVSGCRLTAKIPLDAENASGTERLG